MSIMGQERSDKLEREKAIALYSDILSCSFRHGYNIKDISSRYSRRRTEMELRRLHSQIRILRDERKYIEETPRFDERERNEIQFLMRRLSNNTIRLTLGGKVSAHRDGLGNIYINVRHMWRHKIWKTFYEVKNNFKHQIILTAEKVKVNNKLLDVYDVTAFHTGRASITKGYVTVTKTENSRAFFADTASASIKKAMNSINREIDRKLKGEL